jgi:general secretion pathway protein E
MNAAVDLLPDDESPTPAAKLDETVLAAAVAAAERGGSAPLDVLVQMTGLDSASIAAGVAELFRYRYVDGAALMRLEPAFDLLAAPEAARRGCVLAREGGQVLAVIADPFDRALRPWLEARAPGVFEWAMAARADIAAFVSAREQVVRAIDSAVEHAQQTAVAVHTVENLSLASINDDASPIVKLVHSTVFDALRAGASDVHLETIGTGLVIRYRIDGVLVPVATVAGQDVSEQVLSRIKVMSELDISERRVPQDGRFKIAIDDRPIDFRVSVMPSVYGEDAVLRVLDKRAVAEHLQDLRLEALGFDPRTVSQLRRLAALPHGMLLVTGPTGSGKTTTLYAALSETNTGSDKVVTIEDPVEYQLAGVLQIPVNEKKGLTFARGLRSILRHDPDKIMVGEIRDPETAQIAIQSALTGHLVFTTVHANNVFDVLGRFLHMGVDTYSFVAALNGILAQRLLRIVCSQCAEPTIPAHSLLDEMAIASLTTTEYTFRAGGGCRHCRGTGYRGRVAVGELLIMKDELREAIIDRAPVRQLKELAQKGGARFLRTAALDLVKQGRTTLEEVNRVTAMA